MRSVFLLLLAAACAASLAHAQSRGVSVASTGSAAGKRVALIVGNAAYAGAPHLRNPPNDARLMERTLRGLGFETTLLVDGDNRKMVAAINVFGDRLRRAEVGLFYYSGHGMQVKGENYLIPVDATLQRESDAQFETVDAKRVLAVMADAGNPVNVVILDACRNNPFGRSFRSLGRGLAAMSAQGTLIAYATGADTVAQDGDGANSPYTASLARHLAEPNVSVSDVFSEVSGDVQKQSGGQQVPFIYTSLSGRLVLLEKAGAPGAGAASAATGRALSAEDETWAAIKDSHTAADFQDYLGAYPKGKFAIAARAKLRGLEGAGPAEPAQERPAQQAAVQALKAGATFKEPVTGMEFVAIPGGEYEQGCHANAGECNADEKPSRRVRLKPFWLGKTVVTQGQWKGAIGYNPSASTVGDDYPVENMSWDDVQRLIGHLNAESGHHYRLPTEAEWEYACRSGGKPVTYGTNSGDLTDFNANHSSQEGGTTAVTKYPPNDLGLYDMAGNVWEWVQDAYDGNAYQSGSADNPVIQNSGSFPFRVYRGGGWDSISRVHRCSYRGKSWPSPGNPARGFRLAESQ